MLKELEIFILFTPHLQVAKKHKVVTLSIHPSMYQLSMVLKDGWLSKAHHIPINMHTYILTYKPADKHTVFNLNYYA